MRNLLATPVDWTLELERERVLPGTVVKGRVTITARSRVESRGCIAALIATEQWKYHDTERDSNGNTRTVVRTRTDELLRQPVMLMPAATLEPGQPVTLDFEVPVPPLGPATFEAEVARLTWELELKLDYGGGLDPSTRARIVVLQPTALLAAGVVNTGQWGLWQSVDGSFGSVAYSFALEPVPLCVGKPFVGGLRLSADISGRLREVRAELKMRAEATVSGGLSEELIVWQGSLPAAGALVAGEHRIEGVLPETWLPSIDLPHGRGRATFDVVIDRPMARDDHLSRDVALATTDEL